MTRPELLCLLSLLAPLAAQEPAAPTAAAATPTVKVTGRVVSFDGSPVAGAAIACAPVDEVVTEELLKTPATTTDASGAFAIEATPPAKGEDALYVHVALKGRASIARVVRWQTVGDAPAADETPHYAAETAIGDVVLADGQQLFGRVRDAEGNPLAGVRVVARDMLEQGSTFRSGTTHGFFCAASSKDSGIFYLPCALANGAVLELAADGYGRQWLQPVAAGTPLEVTLHPTGWVQGRVLDAEGRSLEGARVTVSYELRAVSRAASTGADGAFRLPLDRPGRYRITATLRRDDATSTGHSEVLTGPRENLEILVKAGEQAAKQGTFEVRAVTRDGAKPVAKFQAVALFEDYANRNSGYREYRFRYLLQRQAVAGDGGAAQLPGPGENSPQVGAVRVVAEGFAPATVTEFEWKEPEEGKPTEPLVVQLDPQASIAGIVKDERTGEPVVGAKIWADLKPRPNEGYYNSRDQRPTVTTGAGGTFELTGLGEGEWQVFVEEPGHPKTPATDVELQTGQARQGLVITMPSGADVAGVLEGIELGSGARVFLAPVPKQVFAESNQRYYGTRFVQPDDDRSIPVGPDGRFTFTGVPLDNHLLVVRLPSRPRRGGDLFLPIEPFRVRAAGVDRRFDCSEDQPGRISGKIAFTNADLPFEHLVVVAEVVADENAQRYFSPYNQSYPGPRAFVSRSGSFELRVGPGSYRLQVVDLNTAVLLHAEEKALAVGTGKTVEKDIALALARVDLRLAPAEGVTAPAAVERIEVRFVPKALKDQANAIQGNEQYDSRGGMWWGHGTETRSIVLPEGTAVFLARNEIAQIRVDKQKWQNGPLGRAELEISLENGSTQPCAIEVMAAPAIPDESGELQDDGSDAAADGAVKAQAATKVELKK